MHKTESTDKTLLSPPYNSLSPLGKLAYSWMSQKLPKHREFRQLQKVFVMDSLLQLNIKLIYNHIGRGHRPESRLF